LLDETILINLKRKDLQNYTVKQLSNCLSRKSLPYSGNKDILCDRICEYKKTIRAKDKGVKKMIETKSLFFLTNEELSNILKRKNLKISGNKDEKIDTLKAYFKNL
jgi:hypothetical protein